MRTATQERTTGETNVSVSLNLDGTGKREIATGLGFFDHMLDLFAKHGHFDLAVKACGDTDVDSHHTVEDVGIVLGRAFAQAAGDMQGITRYAASLLPMDEALVQAVVDVSGRPYLHWDVDLPPAMLGQMDAQCAEEFFRAFAMNANLTLHVSLAYGSNLHHIVEAAFKAVARALADAVRLDARVVGVPSTKGVL